MVSQNIGKPFALHHIDRALHRRVIPDRFLKAYAQSLCAGEVLRCTRVRVLSIFTGPGSPLNTMLPHDYSWSERALGFWSPLMLAVLAVASLALRYVANPISCWTPPEFPGSHFLYTNYKCFQENVAFYDMEIGETSERIYRDFKPQYSYHHWVPFALGIASLVCVIPHVLWRLLSGFLWMNTHSLVQMVADNQRQNPAGRHVMLRDSALVVQSGLKGGNFVLSVIALGRKALTCLICIVQVVLVVAVFQPDLSAERKENSEEERDYNASVALPENFLCDFEIRQLQSVSRWTVQCTLPLSPVYNKGFAFLFYVFLLLALCCVFDLLVWICRLFIPVLGNANIKRYLAVAEPNMGTGVSASVERFLTSLGPDGRLLLAVTADHCGPVAAADLTNHLWNAFKGTSRPGPPDPASSHLIPDSASAPLAPSTVPAAMSVEGKDGLSSL